MRIVKWSKEIKVNQRIRENKWIEVCIEMKEKKWKQNDQEIKMK